MQSIIDVFFDDGEDLDCDDDGLIGSMGIEFQEE